MVPLGRTTSLVIPVNEPAELGPEHDGLQRVHARVEAELGMYLLLLAAMVAEEPNLAGQGGRVGQDRAGVSVGAQILTRLEADRGGTAVRADRHPGLGRAVGLGGGR